MSTNPKNYTWGFVNAGVLWLICVSAWADGGIGSAGVVGRFLVGLGVAGLVLSVGLTALIRWKRKSRSVWFFLPLVWILVTIVLWVGAVASSV